MFSTPTRALVAAAAAAAVLAWPATPPALACGGFFCGQVPVDQAAERILFAVDSERNETTMVVQIAYQGAAPDFAWVVPLASVPAVDSLDVFPQLALTALDAQTGPQFRVPDDCAPLWELDAAAGGPPSARDDDGVTVHVREEVGPYDVAVVESDDPSRLVDWLVQNGFRVTDAMKPYIALHTAEGLKFLALKLQADADVSDIAPFRLTLPGTTPSIPLRMTALAAEPEMGVLVFVLADQRFTPSNWPDVEIDDTQIKWSWNRWPDWTNWTALVARTIDAMGGQGFVTEMAGSTEALAERVRTGFVSSPEQEEARDALLPLLEAHPYVTRLYARLSAEEMISDPIFRRSSAGDVDPMRQLPRVVDGVDLCDFESGAASTTECDFATCGAGGLCREATVDGRTVAGCACVPGATARTTFDPSGRATVTCQDRRMSFLNPGDRGAMGGSRLPDACVGYDCGAGSCTTVNMTPTCICDRGYVATGGFGPDGERLTTCVAPDEPVPGRFYDGRLPDRPTGLPIGLDVAVAAPPSRDVGGGACATAPATPGGLAGLALGLLGLVALRRRRSA